MGSTELITARLANESYTDRQVGDVFQVDGVDYEVIAKRDPLSVVNGYQGYAYSQVGGLTDAPIYVSHRGTETDNFAGVVQDLLVADTGIALTDLPWGGQLKSAVSFTQELASFYGTEKLVITGHSLGGNLGQAASVVTGIRAVVYNGPGILATKESLEAAFGLLADEHGSNITNYIDRRDLIGNYGDHLGRVVAVGPPWGVVDYLANVTDLIDVHSMDLMIASMSEPGFSDLGVPAEFYVRDPRPDFWDLLQAELPTGSGDFWFSGGNGWSIVTPAGAEEWQMGMSVVAADPSVGFDGEISFAKSPGAVDSELFAYAASVLDSVGLNNTDITVTSSWTATEPLTVESIAAAQGLTVAELIAFNPILTAGSTVSSGETLVLPDTTTEYNLESSKRIDLLKNSADNPAAADQFFFNDELIGLYAAAASIDFGGQPRGLAELNQEFGILLDQLEAVVEAGAIATKVSSTGEVSYVEADGGRFQLILKDTDNNGVPDKVEKRIFFGEGEGEFLDVDLLDTNGDGQISLEDTGAIVRVEIADKPPITGTAIGEAFGSALGNYIAGDNAFAQVAIGAVSSTFFGSIGGTIEELFEGDSFDEAASQGFANFGERLGAKAANLAIGQISSFIVGEVIGGDSFAADFGRATANYFVSSTISQAVGFEVAGNTFGNFAVGNFNFDPLTAIAGFFASQLASSIVTPATQEAALVSTALSSIAGAFGATLGTVGSIVPIIGTFVGVLIGQVVGTLLGNLLFGSPGTPHAFASVVLQPDGTLDVPGVGWSENGGSVQDAINIANGVVSGLNPIIELLGGDAAFTGSVGSNWYLEIGYRAGEGFQWNKPGVGYVGIVAFEDLFTDIANEVVTNRLSGGDAFGRRVYHYGTWTSAEELMVELTVAADYRSYLENRAVIDALIAEAPDTAFSIGWLTTIAQAVNMGLTNPDALQNKIEGTAGNDVIAGTVYNDEITGGAGNDTLDGGVGNDLLRGGAGNDILRGGEGQDSVSYAEFTSGVVIDLVALAVTGAGGTDTLESIERAFGSQANDTIIGSAGAEILSGLGGADAIQGGAGDDTIEGGAGADGLDGGAGFDLASYAGSDVGVHVTLQANASTPGTGVGGDAQGDSLLGFEGIIGSLHSDILVGNTEDNLLIGSGGNDFLEGGVGADELLGGDGADFAVYTNSNVGITVNLETGEATGGHAEGDTFDSIEYVIGSDYDDTITGDALGNLIEGGKGGDTLDGGDGMDAISYANSSAGIHIDLVNQTVRSLDVTATVQSDAQGDTIANFEHVIGTNFDDEIIVGHDNAVILAGAGDDVITPFSGNVSIDGGAGYDTADFSRIDAGGDFQPLYAAGLFTGSQWQDVQIFQGSDIYAVWDQALQGTAVDANSFGANTNQYDIKLHSIEMLRATEFDDRIAFNDIGQHVDAAGGNDQMIGQSGNDVFHGGTGDDALDGAGGNDTLRGDEGDDVLHGGAGADTLYGGDGNDTLQGDGQFNANPYGIFLTVDTGPQGSDYLDGGAGNDALHGGGGNDVYRFGRGYGSDTIVDSNYVAGPPAGKLNLPTTELSEAGNDTLVFADDVVPTDIEATSVGDTLVLKIKGTNDQITITGMGHSFTAIESLQFDALGLTIDLTGLGAAGAASVIASIGNDAELFTGAGVLSAQVLTNVTSIDGLADVDGDGYIDVVANGGTLAAYSNSVDTFRYALDSKGFPVYANGIFHAVPTPVTVPPETSDVLGAGYASGDVDGDGHEDLVHLEANSLTVEFGDGNGNYSADPAFHVPLPDSLDAIFAAGDTFDIYLHDKNGDGRDDFYFAGPAGIGVFTNNFAHQIGTAASDSFVGDEGSDVFAGLAGNDSLSGGGGRDGLRGDEGADTLDGGAGNDYLEGGAGNDTLIGGADHDRAIYHSGAQYYTITQSGGSWIITDINGADGNDGTDTLTGVEEAYFDGRLVKLDGSNNDPFATGAAQGHVVDPGTVFSYTLPAGLFHDADAADTNALQLTLVMADGRALPSWLTFNAATRTLSGTPGAGDADVLDLLAVASDGSAQASAPFRIAVRGSVSGTDEDDTLDGLGVYERMSAGDGNDTLRGSAGGDWLDGGTGIDTVDYSSSFLGVVARLDGGLGSAGDAWGDQLIDVENIIGTQHDDVIYGSSSDNVIDSGSGVDWIDAGAGNDTIITNGESQGERIFGGAGWDVVDYSGYVSPNSLGGLMMNISSVDPSTLFSVLGHARYADTVEEIIGTNWSDIFVGDDNANTFRGLAGDDTLIGWGGNDILEGGAGADSLQGGDGYDTASYVGSSAGVVVNLASGTGSGGDAVGDTFTSIEALTGSAHNDLLYGDAGGNQLRGGAGSDQLTGLAGGDYLDGGAGSDFARYDASTAGVNVNLTADTATGGYATGDVLDNIEHLIGSAHADLLTGDANSNHLYGQGGNDTLYGQAGNDVLLGGTGTDALHGGDGIDRAQYSSSTAGVTINLFLTTAQSGGNAQGDILTSIEDVFGSNHADTISGDHSANTLWGYGGNDSIYGNGGDDFIYGQDGNDTLIGQGGADYLDGGAGTDLASFHGSTVGVTINLATGEATGGTATGDTLVSIEELQGSNHNDGLTGDAGANRLLGLAGNDTLEGGSGADVLDGGAGSDIASYQGSSAGVSVDLAAGTASGGDAEGDTLTGIEWLRGSAHDDLLIGGGVAPAVLWGEGGNDSLHGHDTQADELYGGDGHDYLFGNGWNDYLSGGVGNDQLTGGAGADILNGGEGSDFARYDASTAGVNVNLGTDTATGGHATGDTLDNIEHLIGSAHADVLTGDVYSNTLYGLAGSDSLYGGLGNDVFLGGTGADAIHGGDGIDQAQYSSSASGVTVNLFLTTAQSGGNAQGDILTSIEDVFGSDHADTIYGDNNVNTLWGYGGNDGLHGNGGNDVIYGQDGNDTVLGGGGDDTLYGGDGDDVLAGNGGADTLDGGDGIDTASYAGSGVGVTANLLDETLNADGEATGDTFTSIENLRGSALGDTLTGDAGANRLEGLAGNDTLFGGAGADALDGGDGVDTASYAGASAAVTINLTSGVGSGGDAEGDTLTSIENVIGSSHDDMLWGGAGVNTLSGGDGNDNLLSGAGATVLDGGAGLDWANYYASTGAVTVNLAVLTASGGYAEGDTLIGTEWVFGSAYDDVLTGDENANILDGHTGNDTVLGGGGDDTLYGGDGDDVLAGNGGADTLDGGDGIDTASYAGSGAGVTANLTSNVNTGGEAEGDVFTSIENLRGSSHADTLTGDAGSNTLEGREGDDTLVGGAGADILDGGDGVDTASYAGSSAGVRINLSANEARDGDAEGDTLTNVENLAGSAHNDELYGDAGVNRLLGGAGDDQLAGLAGADHLDGGAGSDFARYDDSTAGVDVDLGADTAAGGHATGDTLDNIEHLLGSNYADVLAGDANSNTLFGKGGNDTLSGGAGNDELFGGLGADVLDGGVGVDVARYDNSTEGVTVDLLAGTGVGGDAEGDVLTNIENVVGSAYNDLIYATASTTALWGAGGGDVLVSGATATAIDGGDGHDWANFSRSTAAVTVNLTTGAASGGDAEGDVLTSIEYLWGSAHDDVLTGDASANYLGGNLGNDTLFGEAGADNLFGHDGDDTLVGGAGSDILDGGAGFDTASYDASTASVFISLTASTATGGDAEGDVLTNIENLSGSAHKDNFTGDSNANVLTGGGGNDWLQGHGGADHLDGGDGVDWGWYALSTAGITINLATGTASGGHAEGDTLTSLENLFGSEHDDVLTGDAGANELRGNGGSDTLIGGAGADTLRGGDGVDTASYLGSSAAVTVDLAAGTGSGGDAEGDTLTGIEYVQGSNVGTDWLYGDAANNVLYGQAGNDVLYGRAGADVLYGGADHDLLIGGAGADYLDGGDGFDSASYQSATSAVAVNLATGTGSLGEANGEILVSIESLYGSAFDDTLIGDAGTNSLWGGAGADTLDGGAGSDTVSYVSSSAGVTVDLFWTTAQTGAGDAAGDILSNIENVVGSSHGDVLYAATGGSILTGGDGDDNLVARAGVDTLDGGAGTDWANYSLSTAGLNVDLSLTTAQSGGFAEGDILIGIEKVYGSNVDDTIRGHATDDYLVGYGGNDVLEGRAGADTLDGGDGVDTASYAGSANGVTVDIRPANGTGTGGDAEGDVLVGIENIIGSSYGDTLWGNDQANVLTGGAGDDTLVGGAGADGLDGGAGFDTVNYSGSTAAVQVNIAAGVGNAGDATGDTYSNIEKVIGSAYNDTIWLGLSGHWAYGGAGNDVLVSSASADVLDGETGQDEANYNSSSAAVTVNLTTGVHTGGTAGGDTLVSIENLFGSNYNDTLTGDAGANTLSGYGGNDVLEGGAGADALDGGDGFDTASYGGSSAGVTVDLQLNTASGGDAEGDTLIGIENVIGSAHNDVLYAATTGSTLSGGDGFDNLVSREGADVLDGGTGNDWANYNLSTSAVSVDLSTGIGSGGFAEGDLLLNVEWIYGSSYDDVLVGDAGANILYGMAGGDLLTGGAGADTLDGGDGVDTASYAGSAAGVTIDIRPANGAGVGGDAEGDVLVGIENVTGSSFGDTLWGNDQANVLIGGAGDDSFVGGAGNDTILGGAGNDTLRGQAGADVLDGGDGVDTVRYDWDAGPVTVNLATGTASGGDAEGDTLISIENLVGSALNDVLTGDAGNNSLSGLDGDDVLFGGAGTNSLQGGSGADTAVFSGNFADYAVSILGTGGTVSGLGETSSLTSIETLSFADRTISLDALNNAPILVSVIGDQTAFKDVPLSLDVSGNFVDIDAGDTLTYAATLADGSALPAWVSIDAATGVLSGTATTGDMGLVSLKVIATDGSGATAEAVFDLDVTRTNVAPTAGTLVDQAGSEGTALAFTIPGATFADADAGEVLTLSATLSDGSALPTWLTFDAATGAFSGTPTNTSAGVLSLSVTATDSFGETAAAGFDLTIANVNDAPTAASTTGSVNEGQVYTLDLATLSTDLDGDALTFSLPVVPGTGTASLAGSVLTYTSVVGGFGPASIGYQVNDGNGGVANGTVDLTVNNINFAPTAGNSGATVNEGQGFSINLATLAADIDGDALTYSINSGPAVGSASISGSTLTFNSTIGTSGNHNIGYTVSDGQGGTANGIVTATINDINFAPTANNSSGTVNEGQSFSINLATLAADIDGDALTYSINSGPAAGSASISGSTLTYTSVNGQPGNYNIGYTVSDGHGGTANANISANIIDLNYAPTAVDDSAITLLTWDAYTGIPTLLANDTDPDGDTLSIVGFSNFVNVSSVTLDTPNNQVTWVYSGTGSFDYSFSYTVSDGHGNTSSATANGSYAPLDPTNKPIAFDLDGDGIELVNADESDIFFDLNGDGDAEDTGWVDSDDALLAYDKNDDGEITDFDEVSFVGYKEGARTDLEGLQAFDTNGDGILDASDAEFGSFNIWQDVNQNGVSDAGELRSLTAAGIASIALVSDETVRVAGDNVSFGIGQFTRTDGTTGNFSDTGFGTGQGLSDFVGDADHSEDESGLIAGGDVVRLKASLEEVLEGHFQSSLLVASDTGAGPQPNGEQNIAGLVSAMAAFDPKTGGEAQINATEDDRQVPILTAWVA